ncbi:type VI secretion system baseplate subunit TssG [Citrobacter portucalensis]|uniref:type VI secretion system baseplate subunit TssG n=1 Tax=Citrobacter portucalensis TaxID=1639133 RepID=UPI00226B2065|nr:type VI secretion system baseplate subunit TssG [Citrobacter portucalensis]MCX9039071.1 type VI secretion system baseplate subunit TssG [Citrobacter portucalensis]MCX9063280.1 type VI secretion system baseplate subunit TssG [Citrobacter portucalensis]
MAVVPIISKFNIFQQIRLLLRQRRNNQTLDDTLLDEQLRITSTLSLNAPHGEIESLYQTSNDAPVQISAWYNGLTGAMGALPTVYTEWLVERQYRYSDHSAKAFIDIFDHRLYCLDYLAWQKNHLYALAESQSVLPLHNIILSLSGLLCTSTSQAQHATLFTSPVRSMVNLERWLSLHFGVPVQIIPFTGGWRDVEPHICCRLGNPEQPLLTAPMIGSKRREVHAHFNVLLGPVSPEVSKRFIAQVQIRQKLWSCIRDYVGPMLDFSILLTIKSAGFARRQLGMGAIGLDLCIGNNVDSHLHQVRLSVPTV